MLRRVLAVMLNSYREAVRARVLHALFAVALATAGYSLIVGEYAFKDRLRVVSDIGAASTSLYGIVVAIVLGATSLHRELSLKTIFPILARPIRRTEYLVAKYLGIVLTVGVFIAANSGALLLSVAAFSGVSLALVLGLAGGATLAAIIAAVAVRAWRTFLPIPWALVLFGCGAWLAGAEPDAQKVLLVSASLTLLEVCIVAAVATLFSSFSSPVLTAVFTLGVFVVGRSADTLANLPEKVFGPAIKQAGEVLATGFPDLMVYVPARTILLGTTPGVTIGGYLSLALLNALAWSVGLLAVACLLFERRDFR